MARKTETWAATYIHWESTEDSYEEGELDKSNIVLSESFFIEAKSPGALLKELSKHYGLSEDKEAWSAFDDGRLECQFMVDDDNQQPTDREIEQWKVGKKRLWSARVDVGVVRVTYPSTEEIAEAFGVEDMGGT